MTSMAALDSWIANPVAEPFGWTIAFSAQSPSLAMGAHVALKIQPKLSFGHAEDGRQLAELHAQGPPGLRRKQQFRNLAKKGEEDTLIGFQPVKDLLLQLRERFDHVCLFFWDALAADQIFVVWKPTFFLPRPLKPTDMRWRLPIAAASSNDEVRSESPVTPCSFSSLYH
jgi:hypothetical protein